MNVMLDLETMGTDPNAAIVAIGAVKFDTDGIKDKFYRTVDLETSVKYGGAIDAETVMWWLNQGVDARNAIINQSVPVMEALTDFSNWLKSIGGEVKVWGNGAAFDNVILSRAYTRAGLKTPWSHKNDRCYRTIKASHPDVKVLPYGIEHNALDDAIRQAIHLMTIWSLVKNSMGGDMYG